MRRIVRRAPAPAKLPVDLHPVLRRVYAARGACSAADLDYALASLPGYETLGGIGTAAELLVQAIEAAQRIVIVADYDADGATACAVAVRGLRALGAAAVDFVVPNRFEDGYGLTPGVVAGAAALDPALIVTVDNGISSLEGVAEAARRGLPVLVTDHHLPGPRLPDAAAIVNPNCPGDAFPSRHLAGVGVMFYVLLATRARLRSRGAFATRPEPRLADLLDLVALGTVADVVRLDHLNRVLVANGLRRIRAGQAIAGIRALAEVARRDTAQLSAGDLGYVIAPRINAAGRLADMALGIRTLVTDDIDAARAGARQLDALNRERREIEAEMLSEALERVDADLRAAGAVLPPALALHATDWHQGVVGLIAGRLKDRHHRPTVVFAEAADGMLRGSARSLPGIHVRDVLATIAAREPGLIPRFGGHALAAGLSIARADLDRFRDAFVAEIERATGESSAAGVIESDGSLDEADLDLVLAQHIEAAGPWGQGFPEPLFDDAFDLLEVRPAGERHRRLRVRRAGATRPLAAIAFAPDDSTLPLLASGRRVRLAYRLTVDRYWDAPAVQLVVEHALPE